jgi:hypothetical protein
MYALKQGLETSDRCVCVCCVAGSHGRVTLLGSVRSRHRRIACADNRDGSHVMAIDRLSLFTSLVLCLSHARFPRFIFLRSYVVFASCSLST